MQMIDGVEYLDGDEAATLLAVKKATLYAYVSRGLLESFRQAVGRRRLYRRDAIERLREVRPSDEPPPAQPAERPATLLPDASSWAEEH